MELFKALSPRYPVFLLVLIGFIFAHWKKISLSAGYGDYCLPGNAVPGVYLPRQRTQDPDLAASIVILSTFFLGFHHSRGLLADTLKRPHV
jgi:hypothetical protein